ncbi:SDR family oxidoreductase [Bradyrhizobium sp. SEMIA]|uniref:SDR family NAD(P)-dependent oxidoreductase n=1 Tax=Bradyrhizobium sp. SEMIA TaxID=2597515 RepID=UPI002ACECE8C|nr:SDR family oxidoreductase [Bradyrhizobium sp. SEMIA]
MLRPAVSWRSAWTRRSVPPTSWSIMPASSSASRSTARGPHENWRQVFDVNVNGTFNMVHAFIPALRKTHGSIINVASVAAFGGMNGALGYSPSKGAVRLFTQALARDLAPDGIRVNAVAPGIIATEMSESTRDNPTRLSGLMARTPTKRVGQPDEIAGPVIFLASAMASYVNGVILPVDGGYLA